MLLGAIIADVVLAFVIIAIGIPGFTALPLLVAGSTLLYLQIN